MKTKETSTNFDNDTYDTEEEIAFLLEELKIVEIEEGRAIRQLKVQQKRKEDIKTRIGEIQEGKKDVSETFQDTGLKDSSTDPKPIYIGSPVNIRKYNKGKFRSIDCGIVSGTDHRGYIKVDVTTITGEKTHTHRAPGTCIVTGKPNK